MKRSDTAARAMGTSRQTERDSHGVETRALAPRIGDIAEGRCSRCLMCQKDYVFEFRNDHLGFEGVHFGLR